ncbi:TMEM165/GDT1 family protein [Streptomyces cellulosae]|uniref:GDT1 family protein n=5 Tax=Streptomyces TaxID=1883 RepID=A0ABU3J101_9ACTN|nr:MULTISPECIES: TMEM165/GDT1 family protein [Actinomycetes]MBT2870695.1 TMEM165/GDT1 family protein [Streptomyces sp. McG7]MBT2904000.1 TMEM165/GDT1 family protein [Streptomyces sp. McG8]MCC9685817.1 TMEM165/GDT1 family protein [Streptomyces sp. MNU103]MCI3154495.1 TMEM165/GDT1 family protein [Streptomyces sp. GB4-14]MCP8709334.1 TMEM165/GDT1 family protein [Streptomyces sp. AC04842]MCP9998026.1 TMEM165/GDT1 family protein [Streptomyces werraensis]MCX4476784.1 TMEM165/GDT1 family protein [S
MISLTVTAVVFGVVFLAELPDKTALAGLVLGTRYRASYVFAGVAAAFAVHVALAVAAGSVLTLLPQQLVHALTGVLFLAGAAMLLLKKDEDEEEIRKPEDQSFWKVAGAGFMLILVAEFGDLTQIMTANLAARYDDPLSVGLGAVLALWAVAGLGIVGGKALMKRVPLKLITRIAALLMLGLGVWSLWEAVAG